MQIRERRIELKKTLMNSTRSHIQVQHEKNGHLVLTGLEPVLHFLKRGKVVVPANGWTERMRPLLRQCLVMFGPAGMIVFYFDVAPCAHAESFEGISPCHHSQFCIQESTLHFGREVSS